MATDPRYGSFLLSVHCRHQNKGFENSGYNIAASMFIAVGLDKDAMTLGDVTPSGAWEDSSISFMTAGGATAKVAFNGSQVAAKYIYWPEDWEPEDGAGWYLYADDDATVNQNMPILFLRRTPTRQQPMLARQT